MNIQIRCAGWALAALALGAVACSNGGGETVKCFTDTDCPEGQQCVGGQCQLPGDPGINTCTTSNECPIGQYCDDGLCRDIPDEPREEDGGAGDDGGLADGGADGGDTQPADPGADEDERDFSRWNFSIALRRGGTSGPASTCIDSLNPPANAGPVLEPAEAGGGYTLSGTFRDAGGAPLAGATVRLLGERPFCRPQPVTTDGGGTWAFHLPPGGPYDVQAEAADGRVGHLRLANLQADTNQDILLPETEPLSGGPLCTECAAGEEVWAAGWTVETWYRDGPDAGKLAHAGVISGEVPFAIPLEVGRAYDWIAAPPPGGAVMPRQLVREDVCHLNDQIDCSNESNSSRANIRVKPGNTLSGTASAGGTGAPQSLVIAADYLDPRLVHTAAAATGGSYQLQLPVSSFDISVQPSPTAFEAGAMLYYAPQQTVVGDTVLDADMAIGQQVAFTGRIVDGGGNGVGDAELRLIVNDTPMVAGSYAWCDPNWVATQPDGSFTVTCNLTP